jgi:hypothetical protein
MPALPTLPTLRLTLAACLAGLAAAGCVQVSTGPDDPTSDAAPPTTTAAGDDGGAAGTNCGADPTTGTVLCLGVASCPSLAFDPTAWPSCGFRTTGGTTLDLECLCGTSLCPIGVATTCGQASEILSNQTQLMVCEQVSEQRCVSVGTPAASSGGQGSQGSQGSQGTVDAGSPSTCNQTCLVGCGTAPDCLTTCGC